MPLKKAIKLKSLVNKIKLFPKVHIDFAKAGMKQLSASDYVKDFKCTDDDYANYLHVTAFSDQEMNIAQTWLYVYDKKIIGYITLSMAHMLQEEHKKLRVDAYGNIPGMIIGQIATHEAYEESGVATKMIKWAISQADAYSKTIGCKMVMLNPKDDEDVRQFYKNRKFVYVHHDDKQLDSMFVLLDWSKQE